MVFKRRDARSWPRAILELVYPRGGWRRAASYVGHRLRRLPDAPHRIARGIFAGVFISFTPLFGLHFLGAALVAFILRGNIFAALLATFFGNPVTFPLIATVALELGSWMMGLPHDMQLPQVMAAFSRASVQLWVNIQALWAGQPTHWDSLQRFFHRVYVPYLIGGIIPGLISGLACYYLSLPLIGAYQKLRSKKRLEKTERRLAARISAAAEAEAEDWAILRDEAARVGMAPAMGSDAPPADRATVPPTDLPAAEPQPDEPPPDATGTKR